MEPTWIAEGPVPVEIVAIFMCNKRTTIALIVTGVCDKDVKTTMIDTRVLNKSGRGVRSPLERIRDLLRSDRSEQERDVIRKRDAG